MIKLKLFERPRRFWTWRIVYGCMLFAIALTAVGVGLGLSGAVPVFVAGIVTGAGVTLTLEGAFCIWFYFWATDEEDRVVMFSDGPWWDHLPYPSKSDKPDA